MKKAIVVLSGVPAGKNKFTEICKRSSWVWGINPKNNLRNEPESVEVSNPSEAERKYILENIERFLADDSPVKHNMSGVAYERFLLIAHGVSGKQMEMLKSDFGVFKVHIVSSAEEITDNMTSHNDLVLDSSHELFVDNVNSIINTITK
jgi:hypothetical protein